MIRGVIMSETYFVTGGAGFVGSNFVRYLLKNTAARVVVVDKFVRTGSWENLAACEKDPRFSFFELDTADGRALRAILRTAKPTKVVHLAGETSVDRSIDEARIFMKTNVGGAFEVAQQCRQVLSTYDDDKLARFSFVHASTMRAAGPVDANGEALGPTSPGAASSLAAESIILSYYRTYKLPYLVVRSTNLVGPWQSPERLLPLVVARALTGTTIPLYGDGSARRDWMFVDDYCSGLLAAAKRGRYGAVYELGRGEPLSNREVVAKVLAAVEAEKPAAKNEAMQLAGYTDYNQLVTDVDDRPGHDAAYRTVSSAARDELGWRPQKSLEESITKSVRWVLQNQPWSQHIVEQSGWQGERLGLGMAPMDSEKRIAAGSPPSNRPIVP
jgi:dTDP-glucose 4,6-dehydratase